MLFEILTTILVILSIFVSYMLILCLRRVNQYENFIISIQNIIDIASHKLKQVDSKGHYESDDETGFFFKQIKEIQELLNNVFETEKRSDNAKEKEKK